jgi:RNAse (barnase) inhibitor barstar
MPASPLKDASRAGLYHLPAARLPQVVEQVARAKLLLLTANLGSCHGLDEALRELGSALRFPDWYGANLDALHDCLSDPEWHSKRTLFIQIDGLDALRKNEPKAFSALLEVLADAARQRSTRHAPLWILLTTPASGLEPLPEA